VRSSRARRLELRACEWCRRWRARALESFASVDNLLERSRPAASSHGCPAPAEHVTTAVLWSAHAVRLRSSTEQASSVGPGCAARARARMIQGMMKAVKP
jgi:hypothetical protein